MSLVHLSPGKQAPEMVNAIVEIPTGSRIKYEIDHHTGLVHVDRVLFSPFHYPAEYGFIPGTLADNGCGIPAEALSRVFDPFFSTFGGGTGLGLAVCHRIMVAHGGLLFLESQEGRGTTVHLRLGTVLPT